MRLRVIKEDSTKMLKRVLADLVVIKKKKKKRQVCLKRDQDQEIKFF